MPLHARTAAELVTETLRSMNIVPGDQEPEAFEAANAKRRWEEKWAELLMVEGCIEFDFDAIPIDAFRACVLLLSDIIAPSYGRQPMANPDDELHPALVRLRKRQAEPADDDVLEIHSF